MDAVRVVVAAANETDRPEAHWTVSDDLDHPKKRMDVRTINDERFT